MQVHLGTGQDGSDIGVVVGGGRVVALAVVRTGGRTETRFKREGEAWRSSFEMQPSGKKNRIFWLNNSSSLNSRIKDAFLRIEITLIRIVLPFSHAGLTFRHLTSDRLWWAHRCWRFGILGDRRRIELSTFCLPARDHSSRAWRHPRRLWCGESVDSRPVHSRTYAYRSRWRSLCIRFCLKMSEKFGSRYQGDCWLRH